jgi:hypothetical protein
MFFSQSLKTTLINSLFFLYLFFLFNRVTLVELFEIKIEVSEIIFFFLFFLFLIFKYKTFFKEYVKLDFYFALWPILNILIFFFQDSDIRNFQGIIFSFYSYCIYLVAKSFIKNVNIFYKFLLIVVVFNSILSITGWVLVQLDYETILVKYYEDYPLAILKEFRSSGFSPSPNFLFFHLALGYLLVYKKMFEILSFDKKKFLFLNSIIFLGILFTFSKSILIFVFLIIYLFQQKKSSNINFKKFFLFGAIIFLIFNFFTNFIVTTSKYFPFNKIENSIKTNNFYVAENKKNPLYENHYLKIYPSTYFTLKKKGFEILKENYFFGIGHNNFHIFLKDDYPNLVNSKPHSTIFSIVLLTGILGLILWIFLSLIIFNKIQLNKDFSSILVISFIMIEAINMDIHYFKFIWLILPIILTRKNKFYLNN